MGQPELMPPMHTDASSCVQYDLCVLSEVGSSPAAVAAYCTLAVFQNLPPLAYPHTSEDYTPTFLHHYYHDYLSTLLIS